MAACPKALIILEKERQSTRKQRNTSRKTDAQSQSSQHVVHLSRYSMNKPSRLLSQGWRLIPRPEQSETIHTWRSSTPGRMQINHQALLRQQRSMSNLPRRKFRVRGLKQPRKASESIILPASTCENVSLSFQSSSCHLLFEPAVASMEVCNMRIKRLMLRSLPSAGTRNLDRSL